MVAVCDAAVAEVAVTRPPARTAAMATAEMNSLCISALLDSRFGRMSFNLDVSREVPPLKRIFAIMIDNHQ